MFCIENLGEAFSLQYRRIELDRGLQFFNSEEIPGDIAK